MSIDITHHQLVLDPPFPAAWDPRPRTRFPVTVVRVTDSEGRVGVGSGDVMYGFADHAGWFLGQDPLALDQHAARLANVEFHAGRPWPLDVALWDLAGQIRGEPVWAMLARRAGRAVDGPARLRLYASTAVHRGPAETVEVARRMRDLGFGAMKLRFGRPRWDDDVAVLRAVRDAVGDSLELMVDCNQGWRMPWDVHVPWDVEHAWRVAEALIGERVHWMEEPLHRGDYAGMAELRRRAAGRILLAGGEMTREPYEFRELLDRGCLDVLQPDCVCCLGVGGAADVGARAVASGRVFTPHTWGNGIGVLANLHVAAGVAGADGAQWVEWPFDPPEWSLERRDYPLVAPLAASGGWVALPDGPGLGLVLDEDALARTRSDHARFG